RLAEAGFGERRRQHGADDDDRRDGVGHRHQGRVQRWRDVPYDVVADVDRQHEDDQVDDRGADGFHDSGSGGLGVWDGLAPQISRRTLPSCATRQAWTMSSSGSITNPPSLSMTSFGKSRTLRA